MALRKVGDSSRLKRALSGGLEGFADATSLQALLGGGDQAFPTQGGTVPEDPFGVSIDSGMEGFGTDPIEELIRKLIEGFGGGG